MKIYTLVLHCQNTQLKTCILIFACNYFSWLSLLRKTSNPRLKLQMGTPSTINKYGGKRVICRNKYVLKVFKYCDSTLKSLFNEIFACHVLDGIFVQFLEPVYKTPITCFFNILLHCCRICTGWSFTICTSECLTLYISNSCVKTT